MTFKDMTFSEKADHIWEYYKIHIIAGIAGLIVLWSLLDIYVLNPAPDIALDISVRVEQGYYSDAYGQELTELLTPIVVNPGENEAVNVELLSTDNADPQAQMAMEAKFMGKAEIEELDIIVIGEDLYEYMVGNGYFMDLDDLAATYGIPLPEEALISDVTDEGIEGTYLVDVTMMPGMTDLIAYREEGVKYYAGIFVRSVHMDNAMKALAFMGE